MKSNLAWTAILALLALSSPVFASDPNGGSQPAAGGQSADYATTQVLRVHVADVYTGQPIANAPVQLVGQPYLQTTNAAGWTEFSQLPVSDGGLVRLWTTPNGYAPGAAETVINSNISFVDLFVPPVDRYSTGLIDPAVGGSFVLQGNLPTTPPTPFYMEIDVPRYALSQFSSINITPYPEHAIPRAGQAGNRFMFGAAHVNLRDAAGRKISEILAAPITIRVRPYAVSANMMATGINTADLRWHQYDYALHQWVTNPTPAAYNATTGLVTYKTNSFSLKSCSGPPPTAAPAPPPAPTFELKWRKCILRCNAGVSCGKYTNSCTVKITADDTVTIEASVLAELTAKYGAEAGNEMLGKLSSEIGFKLEGSLSTGVTTKTGKETEVKIAGGDTAPGGKCYDGSDEIYEVHDVYGIKIGGVSIGVISKPVSVMVHMGPRSPNPSCPDCEPIPPLGGGPRKPDNCQ